jgi:hypothetical protein
MYKNVEKLNPNNISLSCASIKGELAKSIEEETKRNNEDGAKKRAVAQRKENSILCSILKIWTTMGLGKWFWEQT